MSRGTTLGCWLLPIIAGVATAWAFPPFHMAQLAWLSLVPLLFTVENCPPGEAFRRGYIAGLTFFGLTTWWVVHVSVPGAVALVAFLALYFGAAAACFAFVSTRLIGMGAMSGGGGPDSVDRNVFGAVVGSASWTVLEWVRGWLLLGGFPWNFLGVSQWQSGPLIQFAGVTGVYGVSALMCFVNYAFYFTIRRFVRQIGSATPMRRLSWEFYFAMLLVCLAFLHGVGEIKSGQNQETRSIRLGLAQPDIPQSLKFDPGERRLILTRLRDQTDVLLAQHPDLIIWPETAMPWPVQYDQESVDLITNILARSKAHLLTGFFDDRRPRMYNAAMLFTPQPAIAAVYRKIHLVAFGEYVPLRALWAPLLKKVGPRDYNVDDFFDMTPGGEFTVFQMPGCRFGTVICYEDTVPGLYRQFVQRDVDFMVNLTNDAWFKTSPELEMHLANAVFRAVENRRPLVRATNNGVTCVVSEHGAIPAKWRCPPFVPGNLSCELPLPVEHTQTFYTRHGDVFVAGCGLISALGIGLAAFRKNRLQSPV
ncbi:MAG TPA: apolipoprotein N-acyltransferase [Verrucomicrobiae bacterium]|nr:apolipoprotein N-acyltransferase [Verrucomicrobiae bacterium]